MRSLLKLLLKTHDIRYAVTHWRLTVPVVIGATTACVAWLLISNQLLGTVAWILIVGFATGLGLIWDKGRL
jgi:hypothetical protein